MNDAARTELKTIGEQARTGHPRAARGRWRRLIPTARGQAGAHGGPAGNRSAGAARAASKTRRGRGQTPTLRQSAAGRNRSCREADAFTS